VRDRFGQVGVEEVARLQVHRHAGDGDGARVPVGHLAAGFAQHPLRERGAQAAFPGGARQVLGRDGAEQRVRPAQQRLHAVQRRAAQLRLVVQRQGAGAQGLAQVGLQQ